MKTVRPIAVLALHICVYAVIGFSALRAQPVAAIGFAAVLIWISIYDLDGFEIPDLASLLLVLGGLAQMLSIPITAWMDHVLGGVLWPLLFWGVASLYLRTRQVQGLGFGDVKLMAGIGLWCGFLGTIWVVLCASLAGALVLILIAVIRRQPFGELGQSAVAFGPFLCLSAWGQWTVGSGL